MRGFFLPQFYSVRFSFSPFSHFAADNFAKVVFCVLQRCGGFEALVLFGRNIDVAFATTPPNLSVLP